MASLFEEAPGERNFGVVLLGDRTAGVTLRRLMESLPAEKRSSLVRKDGGHEDSDLLSFDYAPAVPPEIKQPRFFFFALDSHEEPTAEAVETLLYRPTHTVGFLPAMDGRDAARLASVRALHSRFSFPEIPLLVLIDQASARSPSAEVAKASRSSGFDRVSRDTLPLSSRERQPSLAALDALETIVWDYRTSDHSTRGHPLGPLRSRLRARSARRRKGSSTSSPTACGPPSWTSPPPARTVGISGSSRLRTGV